MGFTILLKGFEFVKEVFNHMFAPVGVGLLDFNSKSTPSFLPAHSSLAVCPNVNRHVNRTVTKHVNRHVNKRVSQCVNEHVNKMSIDMHMNMSIQIVNVNLT